MRCRDARDAADSFLSGEMRVDAQQDYLRHLEACPACRADQAARQGLRASVRTAFGRAPELTARPEFAAELREGLRAAALEAPRRRTYAGGGRWAVAATILLAVGLAGAFWGRQWMAVQSLALAAVGDHRNCALEFRLAEKPVPLSEAADRHDAALRVLEGLPPDEIPTTSGTARVLERHACVYAGRLFAHVVIEYHGARVSLLVSASEGVSGVGRLETTRGPARVERVDSMPIVSILALRHTIFVVGDLPPSDLARLADAVAGPLSRRLA